MLVDAINHPREAGATEHTVLGPFFVHGAPRLENGDDMAAGWKGDPTFVSGRVLSTRGEPIGGATIDLWQSNSEGWYDVQLADAGGKPLRGTLRSEPDGRYWFRTILPTSYPVPTDGPVGRLLTRMGRHSMRPAHLHFMIAAPGFETTVTHLFVKGDKYLESDTVFGVKDSLVVDFERSESEADARRVGLEAPFFTAGYDFVLRPARDGKKQQVVRAASDAVTA
jgi:protocatechuate 3,4-dioxygenase beta subunit